MTIDIFGCHGNVTKWQIIIDKRAWALTIWIEFSVIPGRTQMERFIPVENFRKKGNTFQGWHDMCPDPGSLAFENSDQMIRFNLFRFLSGKKVHFHLSRKNHRKFHSNRPLQKRERTGKEYGCFPFVWKTKIFKWKINYILESLQRIEVFGGGKWQNGSPTNITQNREFVWIG